MSIYVSHPFSLTLFLLFFVIVQFVAFCFIIFDFILLMSGCFLMRERRGMDSIGRGSGRDLRGLEG